MDGLAITALCRDWDKQLTRGRIDKIHQPSARELVLTVRTQGGTRRLLLSAHRQQPRAHALFGPRPSNPEEPPMFCMLLRKRIESGRILSVSQQGRDRVLELAIEAQSELGDHVQYLLILEVMGKHSNLLLCTVDANGRPAQVVDSIVRVTPQMSRVRPVLPGTPYQFVPPQQRTPADAVDAAQIAALGLLDLSPKDQIKALCRAVEGIGPVTAREVLDRAAEHLDAAAVATATLTLFEAVTNGQESPSIGLDDLGRKVAAAPFALTAWPRCVNVSSLDEALDQVYSEIAQNRRQSALASDLTTRLTEQVGRLQGKLQKLAQMLTDNQDFEALRIRGDLLTAYAHLFHKGEQKVTLPNFYDEDRPLAIELDPALTPIENAQRYYRQSSKRKRSIPILTAQQQQTSQDLEYLESVLHHLDDASVHGLEEVRAELVHEGFLSARRKQRQKVKQPRPSQPQAYTSADGFVIRVGRNTAQNDLLSFRRSRPDDLWLHVKGGPGSHVVISAQNRPVPESTIEEAALLAAYFSKARDSANVAVDCTEVRHIWKPAGGRPGLALYDHYRTLFVTPDRLEVAALLERVQDR